MPKQAYPGIMKNNLLQAASLIWILLTVNACGPNSEDPKPQTKNSETPAVKLVNPNRPGFNADTAYAITAKQVAFGPRVPNTEAHVRCAKYLSATLKAYGAEVIEQPAKVSAYTGEVLSIVNIIGRVHPERTKRIMLCGHWDTRPQSDQDDFNPKARFDGAVDGAASAGILLEIARQMQSMPSDIGVDIVLFDGEDYGNPTEASTYCLGSQYFSSNPPIKNFNPVYGILLDMVAASNATFYREGYSMQYAPSVMTRVWNIAAELGYGSVFKNELTGSITDDHYFVNTLMGVPTIDIIHHDPSTRSGFGSYWHTQADNMKSVDKNTMQVVGETLIAVIYSEKP